MTDAEEILVVRRALVEVLTEILPGVAPAEITDRSSLADLGADSIERVEILVMLKEQLLVDVPLSVLGECRDIGTLVRQLAERRSR